VVEAGNSGTRTPISVGEEIGDGGSDAYIIGLGSSPTENRPSGEGLLPSEREKTACSSTSELSENGMGVYRPTEDARRRRRPLGRVEGAEDSLLFHVAPMDDEEKRLVA
jgi:hypothetical protein